VDRVADVRAMAKLSADSASPASKARCITLAVIGTTYAVTLTGEDVPYLGSGTKGEGDSMGQYYFRLALISFRRNPVLTGLMVLAIAFGVAMTMTAFTILFVMARDPIPQKSGQLFAVQIDNGGPRSRKAGDDEPATQLTYRDAMALLASHAAIRQVAMHQVSLTVAPDDRGLKPFSIAARATSPDFFAMFDVPMLYGQGWNVADDTNGAAVVVLSRALNERLFGGANSIGKDLRLNGDAYRVIGVTDAWDPKPRFYDVINGQDFETGEDAYLPLTLTIGKQMSTSEYEFCDAGPRGEDFDDLIRSECVWLQYWAELPTAADVVAYRNFLTNYARDQQQSGRFTWAPNARLRNVRDWLVAQKIVPDDVRLSAIVAFSFFMVCLVCALGLMLAKSLERAGEYGLRRALGASGRHIFTQAIVESGVVGLLGGLFGLGLTLAGLWAMRALFPDGMGRVANMDTSLFATTVALAATATLFAGLYPAWRAMRVAPALQLKVG
jgi:putative ABC transport system permease protein